MGAAPSSSDLPLGALDYPTWRSPPAMPGSLAAAGFPCSSLGGSSTCGARRLAWCASAWALSRVHSCSVRRPPMVAFVPGGQWLQAPHGWPLGASSSIDHSRGAQPDPPPWAGLAGDLEGRPSQHALQRRCDALDPFRSGEGGDSSGGPSASTQDSEPDVKLKWLRFGCRPSGGGEAREAGS